MAERILRPLTAEGRVTIPKELREKHNLKDYVEIFDTEDGILIKAHQAVIKEGNGGTKITDINIPGPGSALAIAIGIAFYSSAFAKDISTEFRYFLLVMAVILLIGLYKIEQLHRPKEKDSKDIATTNQDENKHNGELKLTKKLTKEQYILSISILLISIGIGFLGNLSANYYFLQFGTNTNINIIAFILFFGFIAVLILLLFRELYPKK